MTRVLRLVPVGVLALCLLPSPSYAQTGSIAGHVADASGGALPGVTVEVSSPSLIEKVRSTTTGNSGQYQITALPVGTYAVRLTLPDFTTAVRRDVAVTSDFTANVTVRMMVGSIDETVTVVAGAAGVDVRNARLQRVFRGDDIADLPTTRDVAGILLLVPSLTSERGGGAGGVCSGGIGLGCDPTVPNFNAHTASDDLEGGVAQGRILVDGMVINAGRPSASLNHGSANGLTLDTANVQEVTFTLSGTLGESETGGAAINIVPRTGGNRLAGSYFTSYLHTRFFDRNRGTRLRETPAIQPYNYDYDVNAAFGGPIVKNRLWFYGYAGNRGVDLYPSFGATPGYANLNEGKFGANYVPDRSRGWLTNRNEYQKANVRLTLQATSRNKFNVYWDEQSSCTDPCSGMILVQVSPEASWSNQTYPNRLTQVSWTNPFTSRILLEAGVSYISTHEDTTHHRVYTNYPSIPRVCETGPTVGRDEFAIRTPVQGFGRNTQTGTGSCRTDAINSGSLNYAFATVSDPNLNGMGPSALRNADTYRSRASASYVTGSHNARLGFEGVYYAEKIRNQVNDLRLNYHYQTPVTIGTWDENTRTGNCLLAPSADGFACGNMSLYYPEDATNRTFLRPKPVGFEMNTGVGLLDERVWFGALYLQDQWTLDRLTLSGALRYDHAESGYGASCIGPDIFVPVQADGSNFWCSTPAKGVRYNDLTPRGGVAWDLFGTGKTSVKWNMGKYLQAAGLTGLFVDNNVARRSTNALTRGWDDLNGNRIVDCEFGNPNPHTSAAGDFCGSLLDVNGMPSQAFATFGRHPTAAQLFNPNSICGRTEHSSELHQNYCAEAGQDLMSGWGVRRYEWQFGLGVQHELLPRLSVDMTYNRRTYGNLTDTDTLSSGCDYYGPVAAVENYRTCAERYLNYESDLFDFFKVTAPIDPRLPGGGGYVIRGLPNQKASGTLPAGDGTVTLIRNELSYSWSGVDTGITFRAGQSLRISGGTSTGRASRDVCYTDIDAPNVKGRDGNNYRGGCRPYAPFQTNVRANASYVVPWADLLVGAVFQYRPGPPRSANLFISNLDVEWEEGSAQRAGTQFYTAGANASGQSVNLLDTGDLFGEGLRMLDLKFTKLVRYHGNRVSLGVDVFNLFNSDAALAYDNNYTATRLPDGTWAADNPATPAIEVNKWGTVTRITTPRHLKLAVQFDF